MQQELLRQERLELRDGSVFDLMLGESDLNGSNGPTTKVEGVRLGKIKRQWGVLSFDVFVEDGTVIGCSSVVICTGTFLSGEIHIGRVKEPARSHL